MGIVKMNIKKTNNISKVVQTALVVYPSYIDLSNTVIFVSHKEIISKLLKNILDMLPCVRVICTDDVIKQVKEYLIQNSFNVDFTKTYEGDEKLNYNKMYVVQSEYLNKYLNTMCSEIKSIKELNLSQVESDMGIQVDDPARALSTAMPLEYYLPDEHGFIDLSELVSNTIADFLIEIQLQLSVVPKYPF
jgi:hypothetical protein